LAKENPLQAGGEEFAYLLSVKIAERTVKASQKTVIHMQSFVSQHDKWTKTHRRGTGTAGGQSEKSNRHWSILPLTMTFKIAGPNHKIILKKVPFYPRIFSYFVE